jgi:hypothetical protein
MKKGLEHLLSVEAELVETGKCAGISSQMTLKEEPIDEEMAKRVTEMYLEETRDEIARVKVKIAALEAA